MSISLDHLLPGPEESVRCAEHARSIDVDPGGTAIRADRIVLVETPLPWPKPALAHPAIAEFASLLAGSAIPTRLLAWVPRRGGEGGAGTGVAVFDRVGGSARERRYRATSDQQLHDLGLGLAGAPTSLSRLLPTAEREVAGPAVLICTQGSHDVCCGSEGTRLAVELEAEPGVELFRVSHTGGHRFAPTAMTLPDGRMWGGLDAGFVRRALAGDGDPGAMARQCRGWWGAEQGAAQVAERAVFAEVGWSFNHHERDVVVTERADGWTTCTVRSPEGRWDVEVVEGREVPTIACRQPGGQPVKPAQEYQVSSVTRS
jgi:hypothetical protein